MLLNNVNASAAYGKSHIDIHFRNPPFTGVEEHVNPTKTVSVHLQVIRNP